MNGMDETVAARGTDWWMVGLVDLWGYFCALGSSLFHLENGRFSP
jgi:hypothetical protein